MFELSILYLKAFVPNGDSETLQACNEACKHWLQKGNSPPRMWDERADVHLLTLVL